jgi:predicted nucleic acid-binding protein
MEQYADARLDFVDCCIMALAERLDINQICTFDRRDFVIFRIANGEALELLP